MSTTVKMMITLGVIGIVSGGFLFGINDWAAPKIEFHRVEETKAAIFEVVPSAANYEKIQPSPFEVFKVFDKNKKQIGYALPYEGNGFQGKIRLMLGISSDLKTLTGLKILEQLETPGLGAKVADEPFTGQFSNLSAVPQVNYVKGKKPENPNEIQAITGATISSKSVVFIVNAGIEALRNMEKGGSDE